jgi:arabinofuranosyltransferase
MSATGTPAARPVDERQARAGMRPEREHSRSRPRRPRDVRGWALLLVPVVVILVLGWAQRWVEEDAFLNFRIVDQIRAGHGPVFNVGERVEVATSPLWLWMLVAARSVASFVSIEHSSLVLGLALTAAGVWWAQRAATTWWRRGATEVMVPFGALAYVAVPAAWDWATGGLENGLSIAWLGAIALVTARLARRREGLSAVVALAAGALDGIGALVRPDLAVIAVCALVGLAVARRGRGRELVLLLVGAAALPVLYEVFRAAYYAVLVPNTALAKDSSGVYWSQGWNYLADLVLPYWLWVPLVLAVVALVLLTRVRDATAPVASVLALPVGGLLHVLYITASGGDYLHGRLLLPSLFALLAPVAAVPWRRSTSVLVTLVAVWAVVAMLVLRPGLHEALVPVTDRGVVQGRALMERLTSDGRRPLLASSFDFDDGELARRLQARGERALVAGREPLLEVTPSRTTLVTPASGVSGYEAGTEVLVREVNSLADPVGSHMTPTPLSKPGHRKRLEWAWLLAIATRPRTGPYTLENLGAIPLVAAEFEDGRIDPADIDAARRALRCGALAELVTATGGPFGAGRAWDNLTGSIGRTRLVVPRDPHEAEQRFCG